MTVFRPLMRVPWNIQIDGQEVVTAIQNCVSFSYNGQDKTDRYIIVIKKDITRESRYNSETTLYCKVKYTQKDDKLTGNIPVPSYYSYRYMNQTYYVTNRAYVYTKFHRPTNNVWHIQSL